MPTGTVKFFNTSKGFGFITPDDGSAELFIHASAVETAGLYRIKEGDRLSFDPQPDPKGARAANLKSVES